MDTPIAKTNSVEELLDIVTATFSRLQKTVEEENVVEVLPPWHVSPADSHVVFKHILDPDGRICHVQRALSRFGIGCSIGLNDPGHETGRYAKDDPELVHILDRNADQVKSTLRAHRDDIVVSDNSPYGNKMVDFEFSAQVYTTGDFSTAEVTLTWWSHHSP
jgi:hypothetical protein